MRIETEVTIEDLPTGFDVLRAEARAEGFRKSNGSGPIGMQARSARRTQTQSPVERPSSLKMSRSSIYQNGQNASSSQSDTLAARLFRVPSCE
jgi:hypothetical protein